MLFTIAIIEYQKPNKGVQFFISKKHSAALSGTVIGCYSSTTIDVPVLGQSLNLLSSILTILLTCPNSDTLLCYSNDPFLPVYSM